MNNNLQQEKFRRDLERYFHQLTKGCGRPNCPNPYCASNPKVGPKDPNTAAVEALKLSPLGDKHLCLEILDLEILAHLVEQAKRTGNWTPLVRKIGSVFSTSESLNFSFLKPGLNVDPGQDLTLGADVTAIKNAYKLLQECNHEGLMNALAHACERLVANLKHEASRCVAPWSLRQFLILLHNPMLIEQDYHKNILGPLCNSIASLPQASLSLIKRWLASLPQEEFRTFLSLLHTSITFRLATASFGYSMNSDPFVTSVVKFLDLLNAVNEATRKVHYTDFYHDLVSERLLKEDLKEDFTNWKNGSGFTFCHHAFVLDPAVKSKILHLESLVEMRQQREDAVRQLLFGGFGSIPALVVKIHRDNLIEDSLSALSRYPPEDLKKELRVHFIGEEGVDEGGVQKEWFHLVVKEIFDPKYGMFILNEKTHMYWFNSSSTDVIEFQLIGMLLGLAIYNGAILDIHFPQVVYKKLCNQPPTLDDLKQTHPDLAIGFEKLLAFEGNVEEVYEKTFQIEYEYWGEHRTHDLVQDGGKIPLTNENRQEYIQLYIKYLLEDSVAKQFGSFLKGFKTVCDSEGFRLFRWEELELLICGSPELDFESLERVTIYDNGYTQDHPTIKTFWEVFHSLTVEQKKKMLFFATGSDRSPIGGLKNLTFVITRHGPDSDRLPSAHTCFNHLLLPEYNSKEKLRDRLLAAVENAEGFGML